jgi:hypothetical protein
MSDAASGAGLLAGQGGTPPAGGAGQGNAPDAPWYGNAELEGYIGNKGWENAGQVVEGYQNLEKILGDKANALLVPKEGDEQAWNDFYTRLGRPANASEYKLAEAEGIEAEAAEWFKDTVHKLGLSQEQAAQLFDSWNTYAQSSVTEVQEKQDAQSAKDLTELKKSWGNEFEANVRAGQRAASRFGFTEDEMNGMESAIGTKAMLERFAQIGRAMGEDNFESGGEGRSSFGLTPQVAQQQIQDLQMDGDFQKAYLDPANPGHKAAKEKYTRLFAAAYPGGAQ